MKFMIFIISSGSDNFEYLILKLVLCSNVKNKDLTPLHYMQKRKKKIVYRDVITKV